MTATDHMLGTEEMPRQADMSTHDWAERLVEEPPQTWALSGLTVSEAKPVTGRLRRAATRAGRKVATTFDSGRLLVEVRANGPYTVERWQVTHWTPGVVCRTSEAALAAAHEIGRAGLDVRVVDGSGRSIARWTLGARTVARPLLR